MFRQSQEALLATRLVLPRSLGSSAFLYNDELVFACSTGTSRGGPPDEKITFNSPGEELISGSVKKKGISGFVLRFDHHFRFYPFL